MANKEFLMNGMIETQSIYYKKNTLDFAAIFNIKCLFTYQEKKQQ